MRFVVYGAGAVGGVIGARLAQHGYPVVLIARGAHLEAIRRDGLRLRTPVETVVLRLPAVEHPSKVEWADGDVVLLAMKSQDTTQALSELAAVLPSQFPVVCAQNGVANEPAALRHFANVYGICVMCPTSHLEPGTVCAHSTPVTGILDIGRYPRGADQVAAETAAAFAASGFVSEARPDIMRWKYRKLLMNLGNAVEAACGPDAFGGELLRRALHEGETCLEAAGIPAVSADEDRARRGDLLQLAPIAGQRRAGGSSWQSLHRSAGSIEVDYLNGEIVLLGRLHRIDTPVNALLQRTVNQMARDHTPPGSLREGDLLAQLP